MDSNYIKASLLANMRFKKRVYCIASECGFHNADVLLLKSGKLTEIEIKVSRADLRNDFKKPKHELYLKNEIPDAFTYKRYDLSEKKRVKKVDERKLEFKPNHFLFAVPEEMQYYALNKIEDTPYGLMIIKKGRLGENVTTIVKPKLIHSRKASDYVQNVIQARMSSEIANFWINKVKEK